MNIFNNNVRVDNNIPNITLGDDLVKEAGQLYQNLFPICRSITGDGVRQTLKIFQNTANFQMRGIPSGTTCYDWIVPDEWNIRDAYIKDSSGKKIVDFKTKFPFERISAFNDVVSIVRYLESAAV